MWVFYRTVYVTLGREVHHIVDVILGKQLVGERLIAYVTLYEEASFLVDIIFYRAQIAGVSECVENDNSQSFVVGILLMQQVFDEV